MIYLFSLPFWPGSGSETLPKMRLSEKVREEEVSLYAPEDGQRNTPASQTSVSPHNQSV